jgi:hypothetical protein
MAGEVRPRPPLLPATLASSSAKLAALLLTRGGKFFAGLAKSLPTSVMTRHVSASPAPQGGTPLKRHLRQLRKRRRISLQGRFASQRSRKTTIPSPRHGYCTTHELAQGGGTERRDGRAETTVSLRTSYGAFADPALAKG